MPGLSVVLLDEQTLHAVERPELNVMLVVEDIVHDPSGRRPPERLELRLSSVALTDLGAQIKAAQRAQFVHARERAEREMQQARDQDQRERAAEVARDDARVDTGVLERVVVALHERDITPRTAA